MTETITLPIISALVRAGAIARAQALFDTSRYRGDTGNPAALAVLGSLLKARARQVSASTRDVLLAEASACYAAADALTPAPYLAINVATLLCLVGDKAGAERRARAVLAAIDREPVGDTPYFLAATRAEALLVLDDVKGAGAAMREAAQADPDGWEDRAVTIRQLAELCACKRFDDAWLAPFRPPSAVHFAGHMGFHAGGAAEARLRSAFDAQITEERISFGYGALAAGADIIMGEALLAAGAALHVILPSPPERFRRQSVVPAEQDWCDRHDRLLANAESVFIVAPALGNSHSRMATALAAECAAGSALLKARSLSSAAIQCIAADPQGGGQNTANQIALWPERAKQHLLTFERDVDPHGLFGAERFDPAHRLAVLVTILQDPGRLGSLPSCDQLRRRYRPVIEALRPVPPLRIRAGTDRWDVMLDSMADAADLVARLDSAHATHPSAPAIGISRGIVAVVEADSAGTLVPHGPAVAEAERLAMRAPPGIALATHVAAVQLALIDGPDPQCELYSRDDLEFGSAVYRIGRAQ